MEFCLKSLKTSTFIHVTVKKYLLNFSLIDIMLTPGKYKDEMDMIMSLSY